jgi:hypothetical protein
MRKVGTFKVETSFNIPYRGITVVGQLLEGKPTTGKFLSVTVAGDNKLFQIIGTEHGNPVENDIIRFGLVLKIDDDNLRNYIAVNKLVEQVAEIFEEDK